MKDDWKNTASVLGGHYLFQTFRLSFYFWNLRARCVLIVAALRRDMVATVACTTVSAATYKSQIQFAASCRSRRSDGVHNMRPCMFQ